MEMGKVSPKEKRNRSNQKVTKQNHDVGALEGGTPIENGHVGNAQGLAKVKTTENETHSTKKTPETYSPFVRQKKKGVAGLSSNMKSKRARKGNSAAA